MSATTIGTVRGVRNPATGDIIGEVYDASAGEVETTIAAAVTAQKQWANVPRHRRAAIMATYVHRVRDEADDIATSFSREQGKPLQQAVNEVELHCRLFEGYASRVLALEERATFLDIQSGLERDFQFTRHEPLGVVVGIIPFNFPVEIYAHKVAPSIATGNSIVIKPSEDTPLTTIRLVQMLHEAGVPERVVQVVIGGPAVGKQLVEDHRVAAVSFTGSTETGTDVAVSGARTLKRTILELGGNDAMVVLDDADLDLVVEQAIFGRTLANGQACCANKRMLVDASIHDELLDKLSTRFEELHLGDQLLPATTVGPLVNGRAAARVEEQVKLTLGQGAQLCAGGARDGAFFRPTVLGGVTHEMDVARDMEIFGPVIAVLRSADDDEALAIANNTKYGLSGSVFTRDIERAMAFAAQMETGQVVVNRTGLYRPDVMAFGGYKATGGAREGLAVSLHEYLQIKTISLPGVFPASQA
jgi:acyl-CoA reductase-like NAD-dependent aldehyde dehydrogenase